MTRRAFTLLELLVVIVIIGLLTGLATTSYINAQRSARDNTRKSGVASIAAAVEAFYQANRRFPGLIGNEGASNIPKTEVNERAKWAGCLALDTSEGKSSVVYYSYPTISTGQGAQAPCNARGSASGFNPNQYAPFPNWIPELGQYLNPTPLEKRYLAAGGSSTKTLDEDDGSFTANDSDILGANLSQGFAYRHLVGGYMVYTRLEIGTTDIPVNTPMTDKPQYSNADGSAEVPIKVYSNKVFMIRK